MAEEVPCKIYVAGEMMIIEEVVAHAIKSKTALDASKKDVPWMLQVAIDLGTLEEGNTGVANKAKVDALDAFLDTFKSGTFVAVARSTG